MTSPASRSYSRQPAHVIISFSPFLLPNTKLNESCKIFFLVRPLLSLVFALDQNK